SQDGGDRPRGAGLDLAGLLEAAGLEGAPESDEPGREEVVRGPDRAPRAGRERLEELLVASGEDVRPVSEDSRRPLEAGEVGIGPLEAGEPGDRGDPGEELLVERDARRLRDVVVVEGEGIAGPRHLLQVEQDLPRAVA